MDIEKIKCGLESESIEIPKHQTVEERTNWLMEMMEQIKSKKIVCIDEKSDLTSEQISAIMREARIKRRYERFEIDSISKK